MLLWRNILELLRGPIDVDHRHQALIERRITSLQVVSDLVRSNLLLVENDPDRAWYQSGQAGVACRRPNATGMVGQKT